MKGLISNNRSERGENQESEALVTERFQKPTLRYSVEMFADLKRQQSKEIGKRITDAEKALSLVKVDGCMDMLSWYEMLCLGRGQMNFCGKSVERNSCLADIFRECFWAT